MVLKNSVSTVKLAQTCGLPIVHTTVNVSSGRSKPTAPELVDLLEESPPIDRTTLNAWEDADFLAAVRAAGRRKLVLCALWTKMCIACKCFLAKGYNRISQVACRAHSERISTSDKLRE